MSQSASFAVRDAVAGPTTNVPAGNYSVRWSCNGGSDGDKRLISVGGDVHANGHVTTAVCAG
ncbi:hypothetical protein B5P44_07690 [Mycobacterium sp. CBMA 213]|nr:hypothetical protein [Mycolicibacterium sp. CBMA 213]